jgi:zinc finger of C3HC4-type, RING/TRAF-type zinc finger
MSDPPLQSVYDALQSVYDEVANMRPARSISGHNSPSARSHRLTLDNFLIPERSMQPTIADLDLRDLEYLDPDSHLTCPICHIPFVDPVYVDCGHYFCTECLARYWKMAQRPRDRKPCPTCRSTVRHGRCAPRLIVNMCNDVKVKCPLKECGQTMARGSLESHVVSYCPERLIDCPDPDCKDKMKRKHFLQGQCRHKTHMECECGERVLLEGLETHKEAQCSFRESNCTHCQQPVSCADDQTHTCEVKKRCPGKDFGCDALLDPFGLEDHARTCTMAKMAPHLKAHVANSLAPLQEELFRSQQRVKGLEEGIDNLFEAIDAETQNYEKSYHHERATGIPLHAASISNSMGSSYYSIPSTSSSSDPPVVAAESAEHRHLLALHENLRNTVVELGINLTQNFTQLTRNIEEVDARNSMMTMNETLRLKEELALINNGLYSTRTQVQWLLNRERSGQQPAIRGRAMASAVGHPQTPTADESATGANPNGATTPPGLSGLAVRPTRRTSGGSQERVKL